MLGLPLLALFVYLAGRYAIDNPIPVPALIARQSSIINLGYTASLATVMVALALAPRTWQLPFANPFARKVGDISYGVYLIHAVVLWVVAIEITPPTDGSLGAIAAWTAIVLPISLAYGYLSARFVEQPIRRWAHRFGRQAQADSAAPGGPSRLGPQSGSVAGKAR
jgi:peptidoglycan/LPS O-acetylase OafA/YrhL